MRGVGKTYKMTAPYTAAGVFQNNSVVCVLSEEKHRKHFRLCLTILLDMFLSQVLETQES